MDGTGSLFAEFIASLPPGMRPLVISYPLDRPMGYEELQAFAASRLPATPFILLGESFSGPIAVALAAKHPTVVHGVVLVNSFVRSPMLIPRGLRWLAVALPVWRLPVGLAAFLCFGRWSSEAALSRLSAAISAVAPAVWRARLRAVLSVDVSAELRSVRVPMLYLRGTSDRIVPRSAWSLVKKSRPSARLLELEGPHFLLQAQPAEAALQVTAFAREIGFGL